MGDIHNHSQGRLESAPVEAVLQELERILTSPAFAGSDRCRMLLRHTVNRKLEGHDSELKERVIAIEVFGRPADFSTAEDSIVRVTANAVRKRLAHFYEEDASAGAVKIDFPAGSYSPVFTWARAEGAQPGSRAPAGPAPRGWRRHALLVLPAIAAIAAGVFLWHLATGSKGAFQLFWDPFTAKTSPILLCVASPHVYFPTSGLIERLMAAQPGAAILPGRALPIPPDLPLHGREILAVTAGYTGLGDTFAMARVAGLLGSYHKAFQLRASSETAFADLQRTNVVLVGGSANRWTMHFNEQLKFQFVWDVRLRSVSIRDRDRPERVWSVVRNADKAAMEGYAIIARFYERQTQGYVLIIAGLSHHANSAAAELALNEQLLNSALSKAPRGWEHRTVELLLKNRIVGTDSAVPEVVEVQAW